MDISFDDGEAMLRDDRSSAGPIPPTKPSRGASSLTLRPVSATPGSLNRSGASPVREVTPTVEANVSEPKSTVATEQRRAEDRVITKIKVTTFIAALPMALAILVYGLDIHDLEKILLPIGVVSIFALIGILLFWKIERPHPHHC
jgi:hypothetical protein